MDFSPSSRKPRARPPVLLDSVSEDPAYTADPTTDEHQPQAEALPEPSANESGGTGPGARLRVLAAAPWPQAGEPALETQPSHPLRFEYSSTRVRADTMTHLYQLPGVVKRDRTQLAEAFRMLRNQVLQRLRSDGRNVLAITSPRATPGKTMTALNLALTMAADHDSTVLLVDADFSGHGLQALTRLHDQQGLAEHLAHSKPLPELLINPGVERLVLLPAGLEAGLSSAEMLASRAARALVQELQHRYADRFIIFDLPPLLDAADAIAFLPHVQSTLLVVEEHTTALDDLERCRDLLASFDVMGTVMTAPHPTATGPKRSWWRWWQTVAT